MANNTNLSEARELARRIKVLRGHLLALTSDRDFPDTTDRMIAEAQAKADHYQRIANQMRAQAAPKPERIAAFAQTIRLAERKLELLMNTGKISKMMKLQKAINSLQHEMSLDDPESDEDKNESAADSNDEDESEEDGFESDDGDDDHDTAIG